MGLDMMLRRKTYVKNWEHSKEKVKITITMDDDTPHRTIDVNKITNIVEEVGYWRKANQIHNWFVSNVQNGEDDCGEYEVTAEQLSDLLKACAAVLKNHSLAEEVLPTTSGFFFGGEDYDDDYFNDLEETIAIIEPLIVMDEEGKETIHGDIYYRASW